MKSDVSSTLCYVRLLSIELLAGPAYTVCVCVTVSAVVRETDDEIFQQHRTCT